MWWKASLRWFESRHENVLGDVTFGRVGLGYADFGSVEGLERVEREMWISSEREGGLGSPKLN